MSKARAMADLCAAPTLSSVAMFDDIVRGNDVLLNGACEGSGYFFTFAMNQEECRKKWLSAEIECRRLQLALDQSNRAIAVCENKLSHARRLYDDEKQKARQAITDRDNVIGTMNVLRDFFYKNDDCRKLNNETRERFSMYCDTGRARNAGTDRLNTVNETAFDSTCSILSDLNYSRSDNDFDESLLQSGKPFKKFRPSVEGEAKGKKRSLTATGDRVVATTTVTVHREGPVHAQSTIHAGGVTEKRKKARMDIGVASRPSAPSDTSDTENDPDMWPPRTPSASNIVSPLAPHQSSSKFQLQSMMHTPMQTSTASGIGFRNTPGAINRAHNFVTKTVMIPEQCTCGKRMKFAKPAARCQNCRTTCHTQCKDLIPLPCIPYVDTPTRAPVGKCVLADYSPSVAPMVPGLIVHLVNEVERRGLCEVGLYRVPGAEREVRALKEKFLQNKGIPNLAHIDVHTLCGTVKDFLRSLKETLLTENLRSDFIEASRKSFTADAQSALYYAISQLPQPNRDTLAFLMLHLQKVANCNDVKMPASNLARIFGPTLVGHSNNDALCGEMMSEIGDMTQVVAKLIAIDSSYYSSFLAPSMKIEPLPPAGEPVVRQSTRTGYFGTPGAARTFTRMKGQRYFASAQ